MVDERPLRVVFFGTPEFAVPTLQALQRSQHPVAGVVTQPDRPRGRGQKTSGSPVKDQALAAGLPVLQPDGLRDPEFVSALRVLNADIGVVAAYGKILTDEVLGVPRLGMINVHASLLPRYRGAAPVHRAVIEGERETGVTIMRVVKALDAGPMLATLRRPISEDETSEDVERDLALLGADLLVETVDALSRETPTGTPQDESAATYARRLIKQDGLVDWTQPATRIYDLIRGLYPWPHAFTYHHGTRLILLASKGQRVAVHAGKGVRPLFSELPGTILEAAGDRLIVATGDNPLTITALQAEGRRPMTTRKFLAGHRIEAGHVLTAVP